MSEEERKAFEEVIDDIKTLDNLAEKDYFDCCYSNYMTLRNMMIKRLATIHDYFKK